MSEERTYVPPFGYLTARHGDLTITANDGFFDGLEFASRMKWVRSISSCYTHQMVSLISEIKTYQCLLLSGDFQDDPSRRRAVRPFLEHANQIAIANDMVPVQWTVVSDGSDCVGELCEGELGKMGGQLGLRVIHGGYLDDLDMRMYTGIYLDDVEIETRHLTSLDLS